MDREVRSGSGLESRFTVSPSEDVMTHDRTSCRVDVRNEAALLNTCIKGTVNIRLNDKYSILAVYFLL